MNRLVGLFWGLLVMNSVVLKAQDVYVDKGDTLRKNYKRFIVLPFSFYLKTLGVSGAVQIAGRGFLQDQTSTTITGLVSTNGSRYFVGKMTNVQLPFAKRVFVSPIVNLAHYGALDVYYGNKFPHEVVGDNTSRSENCLRIKSNKYEGEMQFRYLLPVGYGTKEPLNRMELRDGIPVSGKLFTGSYLPIVNGRTFVESSLFYQNQSMLFPFGSAKLVSAGYSIGLANENVDFMANPSVGDVFELKYQKAVSAFSSTVPWNMYEGNVSYYFPIPAKNLVQQVLAINIWARYVDSWNDGSIGKYHRPSPFMGANLGGRFRMRGFPEARFSDRAAFVYTGEYRMIPKWNPFRNWGILKSLRVKTDWIQLVAFGELGRVSPEWNLATFHQKMKFDAGAGVRIMANQMVIRIDEAISSEGPQCQMYINHAF